MGLDHASNDSAGRVIPDGEHEPSRVPFILTPPD
jgi:hypothetical protein